MKLHYVTRIEYRKRNTQKYLADIKRKYKNCYLIPEGGTNHLGVKGCAEILDKITKKFDFTLIPRI